MAFRSKKEQQQVSLLVAVLVIIFGALGFFYRGVWLPRAVITDGGGLAPPPRIDVPATLSDEVFNRQDFRALKKFGDVPVRSQVKGSKELFQELK